MATTITTALHPIAQAEEGQELLDLFKSRFDFLTDSMFSAFTNAQVFELKSLFRKHSSSQALTISLRGNVLFKDFFPSWATCSRN